MSIYKGKRYKIKSKGISLKKSNSIMMIDFYSASVATVEDKSHYELVLSTSENQNIAYLDEYIKNSDDEEEIKKRFSVPDVAIERCMEYIRKNRMAEWINLENPTATEGQKVVCKFWDGQKYIRVSNDEMPENGIEILFGVRNIMQKYLNR